MGGAGARDLTIHILFSLHVVQWKEKSLWRGRPKFDRFFIFLGVKWEAAKLRWAGGAHSALFALQWAQKDRCAQRTGAHARPKPTSLKIWVYYYSRVWWALKGNSRKFSWHSFHVSVIESTCITQILTIIPNTFHQPQYCIYFKRKIIRWWVSI